MSFVLLGQPARKTYTIVGGNGGIDEVAAKPGDEPPSRVVWKAGEGVSECWLTPNVPSPVAALKPGTTTVELHPYTEPPAGKPVVIAGKPIATIPVGWQGKPQTSFLMKKDPKGNWLQDLVVFSLPDDPASFPARSVRVVNLSHMDLFFQVGEKKVQLPPGKNMTVPAPDAVIPIIAAVRQDQGFFSAVNTGRKVRANDRLSLVVYDYDGSKEQGQTPPPVAGILISQPVPVEPAVPASTSMAATGAAN